MFNCDENLLIARARVGMKQTVGMPPISIGGGKVWALR